MLNGFTIDKVELPLLHGEIIDVGFGLTGNGGITVSDTTKRINGPKDNGQFLNVCVFGDSITAESMNGGWPRVLRKSFDAVNGIRFPVVDNYAVAGADTASQIEKMNTVNLGAYNLCLIMLGVNDIQGGVTGNTYTANMTTMINNAANNGCTVIVASPTMYYGQAQSGGKGQPTTRSDEGRYHRAGIRRLCASMGVKFIDINQMLGPILPDYVNEDLNPSLAESDDDEAVNDNIHPTPNTKYLIARAFYNAIAGIYAPESSLTTPETVLSGVTGTDWTAYSGNEFPRWYRDESGVIHLDGLLSYSGVAPPTSGSVIYTLPTNLRPKYPTRDVVWADAVNARVLIGSDGKIQVYGMTSGAWLALSGISFKGVV
jgi:lysophospholipase L1-like esterase